MLPGIPSKITHPYTEQIHCLYTEIPLYLWDGLSLAIIARPYKARIYVNLKQTTCTHYHIYKYTEKDMPHHCSQCSASGRKIIPRYCLRPILIPILRVGPRHIVPAADKNTKRRENQKNLHILSDGYDNLYITYFNRTSMRHVYESFNVNHNIPCFTLSKKKPL